MKINSKLIERYKYLSLIVHTAALFGVMFLTFALLFFSRKIINPSVIFSACLLLIAIAMTIQNYKAGFFSELSKREKTFIIIIFFAMILMLILSFFEKDINKLFKVSKFFHAFGFLFIQYALFLILIIFIANIFMKYRKSIEAVICKSLHTDSLRNVSLIQLESAVSKDKYDSDIRYKRVIDLIRQNIELKEKYSYKFWKVEFWKKNFNILYFIFGIIFFGLGTIDFIAYFIFPGQISVKTVLYLVFGLFLIVMYAHGEKEKMNEKTFGSSASDVDGA